MAKGIRSLLDTVIQALPQVGNLGLLFFLLFFIFAALGVELFGRLECSEDHPCIGLGVHAHFENFGMAFLTLFRVATGDNWNGIMKDTLRDDCDNSDECVKNCCVSSFIAPVFFVVFVLMAQFVLVNVVVAVLMKHLEESNKNNEEADELKASARLALQNNYDQKPDQDDSDDEDPGNVCGKRSIVKQTSLPPNFTFNIRPPSPDDEVDNAPENDYQIREVHNGKVLSTMEDSGLHSKHKGAPMFSGQGKPHRPPTYNQVIELTQICDNKAGSSDENDDEKCDKEIQAITGQSSGSQGPQCKHSSNTQKHSAKSSDGHNIRSETEFHNIPAQSSTSTQGPNSVNKQLRDRRPQSLKLNDRHSNRRNSRPVLERRTCIDKPNPPVFLSSCITKGANNEVVGGEAKITKPVKWTLYNDSESNSSANELNSKDLCLTNLNYKHTGTAEKSCASDVV